MHSALQALKQYPTDMVVLIDVEHAYDKAYGDKLGLQNSRFYYSQPDSGDVALGVRPPPPHSTHSMHSTRFRYSCGAAALHVQIHR